MDPDPTTAQTKLLMRRLAEERARRGLTQAEVARKMATSQSYVAKLEAGANEPRLSTFLRYAMIVAGAVLLARLLRDITKLRGGDGGYGELHDREAGGGSTEVDCEVPEGLDQPLG